MPGITNPAEEYFKDGLWAWDPAGGVWLKLIIDPLTNRLVIDHPGDLEVVQPVPNDLRVGTYGWDGDSWQKQPMGWGYSSHYAERKSNLNAVVGTNVLEGTEVAAGEVWVVEAIGGFDSISAPSKIGIFVYTGAVLAPLLIDTSPVLGVATHWTGRVTLAHGDRVYVAFYDCVAGDDLYVDIWGYKMKIAE